MKNVLELESVQVSYQKQIALKQISFQVYEGEVFGYLGPSGAGKTTTIKALTQQLKVEHGTIRVFGKTLSEFNGTIFDQIGIMSDSNDVYEQMSVEDNLLFFSKLHDTQPYNIEELLQKVDLLKSRKKLAKQLSKGMRQRLLLAIALVHQPKLLFLDEPTASLDPKTTVEIHDLLTQINQSGTTIFLTTHSMAEAEKLCDRIAFLDDGKIVELGESEALKLKYGQSSIRAVFAKSGEYVVEKDLLGMKQIQEKMKEDELLTIHSNEPTLESIFLQVTGRNTYEHKKV